MDVARDDAELVRPSVHRPVRRSSRPRGHFARFILHLLLVILLFGAMGCISDIDHLWTGQERTLHFDFVLAGWVITCTYIALVGGYLGVRMVRRHAADL